MTRSLRAGLAGAMVACAVAATTVSVAPAGAAGRTMAFGMDVLNARGETPQQAVTAVEAQLGRKLAFTRDFRSWDADVTSSYEQWLGARGTVPMISIRPIHSNGTKISWASIAAAQPGSTLYRTMYSWAVKLKAFGHPAYFTLNHEPESSANLAFGTSAQFVAAWRKLHHIFALTGVPNVKFLWIMTSWAFQVRSTDRRAADKWYPGDSYVDAAAADAYNWWTCNAAHDWSSLASTMSGFVAWGKRHPSLSLWLAEFASNEDQNTPGRKAQWINDVRATLKSSTYDQVKGVSYYNSPDSAGRPCNWPMTTSASAKTATIGLARDAFFSGHA